MKIADAFPFFNEFDLLKIRLSLLYDVVDQFVICEANLTHSGKPKPYNYLARQDEFDAWREKIVYLQYEPDLSTLDFSTKDTVFNAASATWKVESGQRNHLMSHLRTLADADIAIVSDADEIWNPDLARFLKDSSPALERGRLEMQFHYYFLNCRGVGPENAKWHSAFFSRIGHLKRNPDLSRIRNTETMPAVAGAGWHFSYMGGAQNMARKIDSFAHQETNTEQTRDPAYLAHHIHLGIDHLRRPGHEWAFHPVDYYPPRLAQLMRQYPHLVRGSLL